MPNKPEKKPRTWQKNLKKHERTVDNSKFYNSRAWRTFSYYFKIRNPLCKDCKAKGVITAATVTDHKEQYKPGAAGWNLYRLEDKDFNPLCDKCHNSRSGKQAHGKG